MIQDIVRQLDAWVVAENLEAAHEGLPAHRTCTIRIVGQMALWEAKVPLTLAVTADVDVYADYDFEVQKQFEVLLAKQGKVLDPHGHEVWMPEETRYQTLFEGRYVSALVAESEFVLISKAKLAPVKNRALVLEALAVGVSDEFMALAEKYEIDLEQFV